MEEMPVLHGFKPGKTKLIDGIKTAAKMAKPWNPKSAHMLILTDGDTVPDRGMPEMPASVRDVVVVGLGDNRAGSFIDGHQSRQDAGTLRQIANRLRGVYHDGNTKQLSSDIADRFAAPVGNNPTGFGSAANGRCLLRSLDPLFTQSCRYCCTTLVRSL